MNEDKIIQKLDKLGEGVADLRVSVQDIKENYVTKTEFGDFKNRIFTAQDEMLTILRKLDEERVFMTRWIERIEDEIAKIKSHLKIN